MKKSLDKIIFLFFTLLILSGELFAAATKRGELLRSKEDTINTLVITSRNHIRMQPEIFHAFKDSLKKTVPSMEIKFTVFNPFLSDELYQKKIMQLLNKCLLEIIKLKKNNPKDDYLLDDIKEYIKSKPDSNLAKVNNRIKSIMNKYQFLIIESSDTYGIHPMFYKKNIVGIDNGEGANEKDIIETVYGLLFLDAALEENKVVWGTCQGSQMGYVHAGGKLGRLFQFKEGGYGGLLFKVKKSPKNPVEEEVWCIGKYLFTIDKSEKDFGIVVYPIPSELKGKSKKVMLINKDFQHSFGLVAPIPKGIKVISLHPLSEYQNKISDIEKSKEFSKVLKNQVIVDAYIYKTMLGTQFHPQYTYEDLENSVIFQYLLRKVRDQILKEKLKFEDKIGKDTAKK
ncbi:MAG TPA: gamma-glutamyl-gamma-aminobutyrate hydrolase family protein [Victivallales bacterium]|nr:gamma-glutamyl-gamma-aminobutyrate hydrolase family protein [Victivallales bacterium]